MLISDFKSSFVFSYKAETAKGRKIWCANQKMNVKPINWSNHGISDISRCGEIKQQVAQIKRH